MAKLLVTKSFGLLALLSPICGCLQQHALKPYAGQWVLQTNGKNLMVLQTHVHGRNITGTLNTPARFTENADGTFSDIHPPVETRRIARSEPHNTGIILVMQHNGQEERMLARLSGQADLFVSWEPDYVPEWHFLRVPQNTKAVIAKDWVETSAAPGK